MATQNILEVKKVTVSFGVHKILQNLDLSVKRDCVLAVVGPNGSGKSVFFRTILGLVPYSGEVVWANDARIGYVPQKTSFAKDVPITVLEFLKLKSEKKAEINSALLKVGFRKNSKHKHHDLRVLNTRLGSLSGGELQRILMAYALMDDPNVLLLDEPTAGVDISGEKTFYELFSELKKDKDLTIIFITHDKEIVEKYADSVLKLNNDH